MVYTHMMVRLKGRGGEGRTTSKNYFYYYFFYFISSTRATGEHRSGDELPSVLLTLVAIDIRLLLSENGESARRAWLTRLQRAATHWSELTTSQAKSTPYIIRMAYTTRLALSSGIDTNSSPASLGMISGLSPRACCTILRMFCCKASASVASPVGANQRRRKILSD